MMGRADPALSSTPPTPGDLLAGFLAVVVTEAVAEGGAEYWLRRLVEFFGRVAQDALTEATPEHWLRRAEVFDAVAHRPGIDWPGQATDEQLEAQRRRCEQVARACLQRAIVETRPPAGSWQEAS